MDLENDSIASSVTIGKEIEKNSIHMRLEENYETNPKLYIMFALTAILFLLISVGIYKGGIEGTDIVKGGALFKVSTIFVTLLVTSSIFLLSLIIIEFLIFSLVNNKSESKFLQALLKQFKPSMALVIALVTMAIILHINKPAVVEVPGAAIAAAQVVSDPAGTGASDASKVKTVQEKALKEIIESKFDQIQELFGSKIMLLYESFANFFIVLLVKGIILFTLDFSVHYQNYLQKIKKNNERLALLRVLHDLVQNPNLEDTNILVDQILDRVGDETKTITVENLSKLVSKENVTKIFNYADSTGDMTLQEEELRAFFKHTLIEQANLSQGLVQNNSSLKSLEFLINFIAYPLALYLLVASMFMEKSKRTGNIVLITSMITGCAFFSDSIKNFIGSIVFIFFYRDFEVGDEIVVDNHTYQVKIINLMTTILNEKSLHITYPNSKFLSAVITNYRNSKACDVEYTFDFNVEKFTSHKDKLLEAVQDHIKHHRTVFKNVPPCYKDIKIVNQDKINATLVVRFNYEYQNSTVIKKRREDFTMALYKIMMNVELLPLK